MLSARDLGGVLAMMPAFATPDAAAIDAVDTIALDALASGVDRIISDGVDVIATTGSFGEFHTLLDDEFATLTAATVDAVRGRVPLFVGCTSLHSREVVRKMQLVDASGADGVLVGIPFYFPSTLENALRFLTEIATMFPNLAIMIYHNPVLHHVALPVGAFRSLVEHPNIVAMKDSHRDTAGFMALDEVIRDAISVFVIQTQYYPYAQLGAAGCWSIDAWMGPPPVTRLRDAIAAGDDETARAIVLDFQAMSLAGASLSWRETLAKLAVAEAGYCDPGPLRAPFIEIPADVRDAARRRAKEWAALCDKWSTKEPKR
jgi:dihydrodipicolinate synthase/N-acetylneuraminate lyase